MFNPLRFLATALMAVLLAGCAGTSQLPLVRDALAAADVSQAPMTDAWWRSFNDENLDELMTRALTENFSLRSSKARVERIRATTGRPGGGALVAALAEAGVLKDRYQASAGFWRYRATVAMSYKLDLWETLSPAMLPADIQAHASRADLSASAITLSASVAQTYFALIKNRAELKLLQRQSTANHEVLELLTSNRFGTAESDEVLRQRQLIAEADTQRIEAEAQQQILTHQLAVLVGAPVSEFELPSALPPLTQLPPLSYEGIPAEWLMRRPDLQAAFLRIQVADPDIASIVASFFPRVNLSTIVSPAHLLEEWLLGIASRLSLPLLDRLNIKLDVDLAEVEQAEALADYRQKVLTALREVEDALVAEQRDRALFSSLAHRLALARDTFVQLKYRYANGVVDYFEVFTALRDLQALEREHLVAKLALPLNRITLAHALAGSWTRPLPGRQQTLQSASLFEMLKYQRAYDERAG